MHQRSDDPAKNLRAIWLGWTGWRHPFDATFTQWAIGGLLILVFVVLFALVIPFGLIMISIAWLASGLIRKAYPHASNKARWGLFALWVALALLVFPDPLAWVTPPSLLYAALLAPVPAFVIPWRVGRFITGERPMRYWLALLSDEAAGPRPGADVRLDPSALALAPDAPYKKRRAKALPGKVTDVPSTPHTFDA